MNLKPGLLGLKPGVLGVPALRLRPFLQYRPLFRRTLRRSSLLLAPACSFPPPGPHTGKGTSGGREVAANASPPRRVNAVRVEEALVAPDRGLLLPQQWLQLEVLYQSSPDTALLDAPLQQYPEPQGGSGAALGAPITAPLNSIVPVPGRRPGRVPRSRAQAMPQLVEPEQQQLDEQQGGEQEQQQQKPATRRRRVRKQQAANVAAAAAAEAPAAPKRRGRPKKSAVSSAAAPVLAVPVAAVGPALAPKRQRRQRKSASSAAVAASGEAALELPAAVQPATAQPQRRRRKKAVAAGAAAEAEAASAAPVAAPMAAAAAELPVPASEALLESHAVASGEALGLEGLLAVVQQLATAAGLPSSGPSAASSSSSSSPMAAVSSEPAAPAELASAAAAPPMQAQEAGAAAAAAPAAAPRAGAVPATIVRSTRAAGSKPSLTRRSRLLRTQQQRQVSAVSAAPRVQEQHVAAEVQQSEGARDAAYLARMRESLQHGRRRKRSSSFSGPNASGSVTMFLSRLGDTPLLGKEHELRLARVLHKGSALLGATAALRAQLGREPAPAEVAADAGLPVEEVKLRLNNREEAKDLLLQYNLRLVVHIAKRYVNQGVDLSDLIQEGEVGLRKAIERYDPDRGFRFSTFAHWYIRQPISRAVAEQGRDVRLPTHVCEVLAKIHRMEQALNKDPDRAEPATKEEIARALGMPLPRMLQLLRLSRAPRLADRGGGDVTATVMSASMKDMDLEEQWEDEEFGEMVEGINSHEHMKQNVSFILSTLPKRERNILRMRYGLLQQSDDEDMTATAAPSATGAEPAGQEQVLQPYLSHQHPDAALEQATALATAPPASGSYGQELSLTEVSYAYGLSKERIRQIEDRALRALRNPWRMRLLHEINNGNRLSAGTLAHLAAAARGTPARRGTPGGSSGMDSLHYN